jgi:hypothetical protein
VIRSDATVTAPMADEAFRFVEDMDSDEVLRWVGLVEPAVASRIKTASDNLMKRLGSHHGPVLPARQAAVVRRTVCNTAAATVTAMLAGRHNLWHDLVHGPLANTLDPWVGTKRQVLLCEVNLPDAGKEKLGRRRRVMKRGGADVMATKLGFTQCVPAEDPTFSPRRPVLLLTSTASDWQPRHEVMSKEDGEKLLRALVHGLAGLGSETARAAWPVVCGGDPSLELPPIRRTPSSHDDDGDSDDDDTNQQV